MAILLNNFITLFLRWCRLLVFIVSQPVIDCIDLERFENGRTCANKMLSQIIINFSVSIIFKLSEIAIISHLFNVSEVVLKMRRHPTAALTCKPGQIIENLPWNQSQQDLFILMQKFYLEGAVSSLGLGRKLKQHEFEEKDLRIIDVITSSCSTSYWQPGQTVSAFSCTLELSGSQSCAEFSGRAWDDL